MPMTGTLDPRFRAVLTLMGVYTSWDHLDDVSVAGSVLHATKKCLERKLNPIDHGQAHKQPNLQNQR